MNPGRNEIRELVLQAQSLSKQLHDQSGSRPALKADDLLLFLYRLRDGYRIVRSTSDRFRGSSFAFLHELLYQLESRPDETLQSSEWKMQIEVLLRDLIEGKFALSKMR